MDKDKYIIRDVDGFLFLDKPSGISSNCLLQKIKHLFLVKKAGHTGTLDPLATGMLVICLGKATKLSKYILNSDKYYRVVARLGISTNTSDIEGNVIKVRPLNFSEKSLLKAVNHFSGLLYQVPSMFSAIKYKGIPLYKYARKGISVPRNSRLIYIYDLHIIRTFKDVIEMELHCSKGTYIRTLIDDFGEYLGCGAHVVKLRRMSIANYASLTMVDFKMLQYIASSIFDISRRLYVLDQMIVPMDYIINNCFFGYSSDVIN